MHDRTTGRVGAPTTVCDIRLENWEEAGYRVKDHPHPRGEIVIGGDIVSAGYYKLPDKTKEDFFEEDGRQWFRTGDIGEIHADGSIKIIGMSKNIATSIYFYLYNTYNNKFTLFSISPHIYLQTERKTWLNCNSASTFPWAKSNLN